MYLFHRPAKREIYTDDLRVATHELDAYAAHRRYFARVQDAAPLNRLLYVDLKTFLPCLNLITTERLQWPPILRSSAFLNREMIELAARMPPDLKLHGFKRKYALKRALEKVLPHDIVWRKKAGFEHRSLLAARCAAPVG